MKMRILVTGAGGNIGRGVIPRLVESGHDLVLSDLGTVPAELAPYKLPYHQLDIQVGVGLEAAAEGADLILHLPAWHGIHWNQKTEADFWRLNVDGTFWAFQAAKARSVSRFVFLSSQAWHGHYDKYGFTKRVGEELCEYHRRNSGMSYVAVRPADLTPWQNWLHYGSRLLYGGVDRLDVVESIVRSCEFLGEQPSSDPQGLIVDAVRPNAFTEADLADWEASPLDAADRIFPGYRDLIEKYELNISRRPGLSQFSEGNQIVGFEPKVHFGTFLEELRQRDSELGESAVRAIRCPY